MNTDAGRSWLGLLALLAYPLMVSLALVIHGWTVALAWALGGLGMAFSALLLPVLAQLVLGFAMWSETGTLWNLYCLTLLIYGGLWSSALVGTLLAEARAISTC